MGGPIETNAIVVVVVVVVVVAVAVIAVAQWPPFIGRRPGAAASNERRFWFRCLPFHPSSSSSSSSSLLLFPTLPSAEWLLTEIEPFFFAEREREREMMMPEKGRCLSRFYESLPCLIEFHGSWFVLLPFLWHLYPRYLVLLGFSIAHNSYHNLDLIEKHRVLLNWNPTFSRIFSRFT